MTAHRPITRDYRDKARFLFGSLFIEDVRSALARHILIIGTGQWETGLEPATSSLGIFTSIDFKEHGAYRDAYRSKQNSNPATNCLLLEG
jgi:hypothetical protein